MSAFLLWGERVCGVWCVQQPALRDGAWSTARRSNLGQQPDREDQERHPVAAPTPSPQSASNAGCGCCCRARI
eukprot:2561998-Rhodomonas_salina.2